MEKNSFEEFHASSLSLSLSSPGLLFDFSNSFLEYTTFITDLLNPFMMKTLEILPQVRNNRLCTVTFGFVHIGPANDIYDFHILATLFHCFLHSTRFIVTCIQKTVYYIYVVFKEL